MTRISRSLLLPPTNLSSEPPSDLPASTDTHQKTNTVAKHVGQASHRSSKERKTNSSKPSNFRIRAKAPPALEAKRAWSDSSFTSNVSKKNSTDANAFSDSQTATSSIHLVGASLEQKTDVANAEAKVHEEEESLELEAEGAERAESEAAPRFLQQHAEDTGHMKLLRYFQRITHIETVEAVSVLEDSDIDEVWELLLSGIRVLHQVIDNGNKIEMLAIQTLTDTLHANRDQHHPYPHSPSRNLMPLSKVLAVLACFQTNSRLRRDLGTVAPLICFVHNQPSVSLQTRHHWIQKMWLEVPEKGISVLVNNWTCAAEALADVTSVLQTLGFETTDGAVRMKKVQTAAAGALSDVSPFLQPSKPTQFLSTLMMAGSRHVKTYEAVLAQENTSNSPKGPKQLQFNFKRPPELNNGRYQLQVEVGNQRTLVELKNQKNFSVTVITPGSYFQPSDRFKLTLWDPENRRKETHGTWRLHDLLRQQNSDNRVFVNVPLQDSKTEIKRALEDEADESAEVDKTEEEDEGDEADDGSQPWILQTQLVADSEEQDNVQWKSGNVVATMEFKRPLMNFRSRCVVYGCCLAKAANLKLKVQMFCDLCK